MPKVRVEWLEVRVFRLGYEKEFIQEFGSL